ncbi:MAG: protein phosphatase 2C domain-containing protein [Pseudomonadota bacterium]
MQWTSAAQTHTGNVRDHNEDSVISLPSVGVWAVADGLGGHSKGDVASRTVVDYLSTVDFDTQQDSAVTQFYQAVLDAHTALVALGDKEQDMTGSTVVGIVALETSIAILHAGDSRAYLWRNGRLSRETKDHTLVTDLLRAGQLTPEEAAHHQSGHVLSRAIGQPEPLELEIAEVNIKGGDRVLLCSDGLYGELADAEIGVHLSEGRVANSVMRLIQEALNRRCPDNVSAIVVDFSYA